MTLVLATLVTGAAAFNSYVLTMCDTSMRVEDAPVLMGMDAVADTSRRVRFERLDGTPLRCGVDAYAPGEILVVAISSLKDSDDYTFSVPPGTVVDQWEEGAQHTYQLKGPGHFFSDSPLAGIGCDGKRATGELDPPSYGTSPAEKRAATTMTLVVDDHPAGTLEVFAAWAPHCCEVKLSGTCALKAPGSLRAGHL
jgi:acetamidase/formamidase